MPNQHANQGLKSQILALRVEGKTYRVIAEQLGCSTGTVSGYCGPSSRRKHIPAPKHPDTRLVDLSGQTLGYFLVLHKISGRRQSVDGVRKRIAAKYLCRCECGKELEVWAANLASGSSTSCGCRAKYGRGYVDLTGRTFGELNVLRQSEAVSKYRGALWVCRCACGREVEIASNCLTSGNNKTCGDRKTHYTPPVVGEIPIEHLSHIRNNATKRNYAYTVEPQYLWDLFLGQERKCALTGVLLRFHQGSAVHRGETTASLDRIDNSLGYVPGNVRWVHKDINKMRAAHDDKTFVAWCQQVVQHNQTKDGIPGWHDYFLGLCDRVKLRSPDPNTKVGCVLVGTSNQVISTGYNGTPFGIAATPERLTRPIKYSMLEHGDRNCLYLAARSGVSTLGSRMYLTGLPCIDCARGIIQAGLSSIVIDHENQEQWAKTTPKYGPDFERVEQMLAEAGVEVIRWVRSTRQEWRPGVIHAS